MFYGVVLISNYFSSKGKGVDSNFLWK